jgi:hypothetical protein
MVAGLVCGKNTGKEIHMSIKLFVIIALMGLVTTQASATIMNFNIKKTNGGNPTLWTNDTVIVGSGPYQPYAPYATYGDHVAGAKQDVADAQHTTYNYLEGNGYTPNIGVTESDTNTPANMYWDGAWPYLTLFQTKGETSTINFTFTPDPGYAVRVNGLVLRNYQLDNVQTWTLYEGSIGGTILASSDSSGQGKAGGPADQFLMTTDFQVISALTGADFYSGPLVLSVNTIGQIGAQGGENFGFNNISFDQLQVPEPASLALLGLGAAVLLRRRK